MLGFKEMRLKAGYKALEVAYHLGVSQQAVYDWEAGRYFPEASRLPTMAKLYKCTVDDLLRKEGGEKGGTG